LRYSLNPTVAYPAEQRAEILKADQERASLRGLERTFGVARQTVAKWLRQEDEQLPALPPL
jgi:transposase-like protein